jgi:pimeloyl-ACP methyl ester carboxylesterase
MLLAYMVDIRQNFSPRRGYKPRLHRPGIGPGSTSHVPQEKLVEVAGLIPHCRLVTIEGDRHTVHQNSSSEYKALIQDFLLG